MKYTIHGYDQQKLIEINNSHKVDKLQLDCSDLVILQWVADFLVRESTKKVVFNGIQYAWVTQSLLQKDLPFISTNKRTFTDRLDKLNNIGLIDKKVERIQGAGTFTYIKLTQLYEDLLYKKEDVVGDVPQSTGGVYSEVHGGAVQSTPKDYSTIHNSNTKENKKEKENFQKKAETAQDIVDFYNEHTDANDFPRTKKASTKIQSAINARIKAGYTMKDIKTAILLMPTLSDWYKGKNDRCWKADLLWLLNDTKGNFARILDGGLHQSPVQKHQYDVIMASNGEINPNEYHPICDGYFIKYDPNLKGYLLIGRHPQKFNVPDGYTDITRPDGAILFSQYGRFKWNAFTREWDESFVIF